MSRNRAPSKPQLVTVESSPIHGKGLFATRRITKGELIGAYEGKPTRRSGRYVLWVEGDDGSYRGVRGTNELRYLNHRSRPNARFEDDRLYAIRSIPAGTEITIHYGEDWK
ncbi:MAG: SET domain-containing protein [Alphaproteobacteria bacterium]|nr:SET domain-containing protein [Alphaproteobacteria bacterium]